MQHGRKTLESVHLASRRPRPPAPEHLTEDEADIWEAVVSKMPPDWFSSENFPILEIYCNHVSRRRVIERIIQRRIQLLGKDLASIRPLEQLFKLADKEGRALTAVASQLKLTPQSRHEKTPAAYKAMAASSSNDKSEDDIPWGAAA